MITTGSKIFYGMFVVAFFAAIVYAVLTNGADSGGAVNALSSDGAVNALIGPITFGWKGGVGDHIGYSILMAFAFSSLGLGLTATAFRDGSPESLVELPGADPAQRILAPRSLNAWPAVGALGAALLMVGLAASSVLFVIGCIVIAIAMIEWTVSNWADTATGDPATNRSMRNHLMFPIEIPVGAVLVIGGFVYCVSRILLAASETGAVFVAMAIAVLIFATALVLNSRPQIKRSLVVGALLVLALIVLAVGIIGALVGPRDYEKRTETSAHVGTDSVTHAAPGQTD